MHKLLLAIAALACAAFPLSPQSQIDWIYAEAIVAVEWELKIGCGTPNSIGCSSTSCSEYTENFPMFDSDALGPSGELVEVYLSMKNLVAVWRPGWEHEDDQTHTLDFTNARHRLRLKKDGLLFFCAEANQYQNQLNVAAGPYDTILDDCDGTGHGAGGYQRRNQEMENLAVFTTADPNWAAIAAAVSQSGGGADTCNLARLFSLSYGNGPVGVPYLVCGDCEQHGAGEGCHQNDAPLQRIGGRLEVTYVYRVPH